MLHRIFTHRFIQLSAVLLCAFLLKLHYSTASVDQLRWILAPTTALVELVSGRDFTFESGAGYMSADHTFLIAASCAGVNFLLTAFLMLALSKLWKNRTQKISWRFLFTSAAAAYVATVLANTIRISVALQVQRHSFDFGWFDREQFHRLEGICVYFGVLMFLYVVSEMWTCERKAIHREPTTGQGNWACDSATNAGGKQSAFRRLLFPLTIYYATTLGFPLLNGAYKHYEFWEHSLFVLLTPLLLTLMLPIFGLTTRRMP